jgi:Tol biopolymer transport system component
VDAQSVIDTPAPACDVTKPFETPVPVVELNSTAYDGYATQTPDGLTVFFASTRGGAGTWDLYQATRASTADAFGNPSLVANVNSGANEVAPVLSADGLTLYFTSNRDNSQSDIYVATRPSAAAAFGDPTKLLNVNNATAQEEPSFVSADQLTLWFSSTRTENVNKIFVANRATTAVAFGTPTLVTSLSGTGAEDYGAQLSADLRSVVFMSTRANGLGLSDLWTASRSAPTGDFGAATPLTSVNTNSFEWPTWLSGDQCQVMLTSTRAFGGSFRIFIATRPR